MPAINSEFALEETFLAERAVAWGAEWLIVDTELERRPRNWRRMLAGGRGVAQIVLRGVSHRAAEEIGTAEHGTVASTARGLGDVGRGRTAGRPKFA